MARGLRTRSTASSRRRASSVCSDFGSNAESFRPKILQYLRGRTRNSRCEHDDTHMPSTHGGFCVKDAHYCKVTSAQAARQDRLTNSVFAEARNSRDQTCQRLSPGQLLSDPMPAPATLTTMPRDKPSPALDVLWCIRSAGNSVFASLCKTKLRRGLPSPRWYVPGLFEKLSASGQSDGSSAGSG